MLRYLFRPRYPPCPNCGHELPIADFYREVGAQRRVTFGIDRISSSPRFRKDPYTGEEVPTQFSITCVPCGATSAVDTSSQDKFGLWILAGLVVVVGALVLSGHATGWMILLFVTMYLGASLPIYHAVALLKSGTMAVTLTSVPGAELANETRAERRARSDHDEAVEIAGLGPEFRQVVEPEPLEPDLADVAARIDAARAAEATAAPDRPEYERAEEEELERAKIVCPSCRAMNQRDFGKCWSCESALPTGV